jgi:hypothetical protein
VPCRHDGTGRDACLCTSAVVPVRAMQRSGGLAEGPTDRRTGRVVWASRAARRGRRYVRLAEPIRSGSLNRVSFSSQLNGTLKPSELLFSIKRDTKSPQKPPHNWCLLPWLQLSWNQERMKKKQSKCKSSNEHKSLSH